MVPNLAHIFAAKEHGTLAPPTVELTTIPEPSTALLVAAGLAGLGAVARRRIAFSRRQLLRPVGAKTGPGHNSFAQHVGKRPQEGRKSG